MDSGGQETVESGVVADMAGNLSFEGSPPETRDPLKPAEAPRPDNIPEKFWDASKGQLNTDALLQSYTELEKKLSAPKSGEPEGEAAPEGEAKPNGEAPLESEANPEGEGEPKGEAKPEGEGEPEGEAKPEAVDLSSAMEQATKVFAETGQLDADARAPFLQAGISNEQIDLYLHGVKAYEDGLRNAAVKAAGVDDYASVEKAIAWAAENWSPKKIEAFNAQSGDVETIGMAVRSLFADFREANPGEGALRGSGGGGGNAGDVFSSRSEYQEALKAADAEGNPVKSRDMRRAAVEKFSRSLKAKSLRD